MTKKIYYNHMLLGVSLLILNACMPEDTELKHQATADNIQTQVQLYSQSFKQYASRSLNAFVNSGNWQLQTMAEGPLDLSSGAYGSLNTGLAENYVSSAYCRDTTGDHYHITWFSTADSDGNVTLKGLGNANAGMVASQVKDISSNSNLAMVQPDSKLKFVNNREIALSTTCSSTISIPSGSMVVAYQLTPPKRSEQEITKTLLRAQPCISANQTGTRTEKIEATYKSDGTIFANGQVYANETALLESPGGGWDNIGGCKSKGEQLEFNTYNDVASAMDTNMPVGNVVTDILKKDLTNIACKNVEEKYYDEENANNSEAYQAFDTCALGEKLIAMSDVNIVEIGSKEEILHFSCKPRPDSPGNITLNNSFNGIPPRFYGLGANQTLGSFGAGDGIELKKTTTENGVYTDHGESIVYKTIYEVDIVGESLNCTADDTIRISCNSIFGSNPEVDIISGTGPAYTSRMSMIGWKDAENTVPNDPVNTPWQYRANSMNCELQKERETDCGSIEYSTARVTAPGQAISWGPWNDRAGSICTNTQISGNGDLNINRAAETSPPYAAWVASKFAYGPNATIANQILDQWAAGTSRYWDDYKDKLLADDPDALKPANLDAAVAGINYDGMIAFVMPGVSNACLDTPIGHNFALKALEVEDVIDPFIAKHHKLGTLELDITNTTGIVPSSLNYNVDYNEFNVDPDQPANFDYTYKMTLSFDVTNDFFAGKKYAAYQTVIEAYEKIATNLYEGYRRMENPITYLSADYDALKTKYQNELLAVPNVNPTTVNIVSYTGSGVTIVYNDGFIESVSGLSPSEKITFRKAVNDIQKNLENEFVSFAGGSNPAYTDLSADLSALQTQYRNALLAIPNVNPGSVNVTINYNPLSGMGDITNEAVNSVSGLTAAQQKAFDTNLQNVRNDFQNDLLDLYNNKHKVFLSFKDDPNIQIFDKIDNNYNVNQTCNLSIEFNNGQQRAVD